MLFGERSLSKNTTFTHIKNHLKNSNHHSQTQSLTSPKSLVQTKNVDELLNTSKQKNLSVPQTNSQHSPSHSQNFKTKPCSLTCAIREAMPGGRYGGHSPGIISGFALTAVEKESAFPFLHHYLYNYHHLKFHIKNIWKFTH